MPAGREGLCAEMDGADLELKDFVIVVDEPE
jgi:hypothetical protein